MAKQKTDLYVVTMIPFEEGFEFTWDALMQGTVSEREIPLAILVDESHKNQLRGLIKENLHRMDSMTLTTAFKRGLYTGLRFWNVFTHKSGVLSDDDWDIVCDLCFYILHTSGGGIESISYYNNPVNEPQKLIDVDLTIFEESVKRQFETLTYHSLLEYLLR